MLARSSSGPICSSQGSEPRSLSCARGCRVHCSRMGSTGVTSQPRAVAGLTPVCRLHTWKATTATAAAICQQTCNTSQASFYTNQLPATHLEGHHCRRVVVRRVGPRQRQQGGLACDLGAQGNTRLQSSSNGWLGEAVQACHMSATCLQQLDRQPLVHTSDPARHAGSQDGSGLGPPAGSATTRCSGSCAGKGGCAPRLHIQRVCTEGRQSEAPGTKT